MNRTSLAGLAALALILAGGAWFALGSTTSSDEADKSDEPGGASAGTAGAGNSGGALSAAQIKALAIRTEAAAAADAVPLASVPGQVTLPPEARVAVSTPFAGTVARLFVLEGESVSRGQPLATVRAAQAIQFSADLARARADVALQGERARRLETLAREGVVAGARADEARASLRQSQASVAESGRLLALAGASGDGTITLRAPISGRVARVSVETGGPVGGETAPFVIEDTEALSLDLQLPERLAGKVRPGMQVAIAAPQEGAPAITGRIVTVGGSLDPGTRSVVAKARLDGAGGLVPGRGVMAVVSDTSVAPRAGVSVPTAAVTRVGERDVVFVAQQGRFVRRTVDVVAEAGGRTVIAAGLRAGEKVAVSGVAELKSLLAEQ